MSVALSILVVTSGRETLERTLRSIQAQPLQPQDEVLVVGNSPSIEALATQFGYRYIVDGPFGCWGQRERQAAMQHARGTHLLFMDDDDYYVDGALDCVRAAVSAHPGQPVMFKMLAPHGLGELWRHPDVVCGNVSGTQFVVPNDPDRLGIWGLRYEGDFDFIVSTLRCYPPDSLVWVPVVIAGCRDQGKPAGNEPSKTRALRVLLVHPGASWSTADVYDGLEYGLEQLHVHVVPYRLDTRIDWSHDALHHHWRKKKKRQPDLPKPNIADLMYHAGVGVLETALREQVDVVLVVSGMLLHPDIIVMLRRAGVRVTVLFTESPYDHADEMRIARMVDGCWTNERTCLPDFQSVNDHVGYLPHAWHPGKHFTAARSIGDLPSHDVVFVGSGFPERVTWFNSIDWTGIDLGLYGTWKNLGLNKQVKKCVWAENIDNATAASLYRRAKVGLNLYRRARGWNGQQGSIVRAESLSPRAYELAQCGAFHLSEYRAEVPEVFGDLVPTFTTAPEAAALIRQWLDDPQGRARIAQQLPGRVATASWTERAKTVLADLSQLTFKEWAA